MNPLFAYPQPVASPYREADCMSCAALCQELPEDPTLGVRLYEKNHQVRFTVEELTKIYLLWVTASRGAVT